MDRCEGLRVNGNSLAEGPDAFVRYAFLEKGSSFAHVRWFTQCSSPQTWWRANVLASGCVLQHTPPTNFLSIPQMVSMNAVYYKSRFYLFTHSRNHRFLIRRPSNTLKSLSSYGKFDYRLFPPHRPNFDQNTLKWKRILYHC